MRYICCPYYKKDDEKNNNNYQVQFVEFIKRTVSKLHTIGIVGPCIKGWGDCIFKTCEL